jgi:lipid A ethanolaminephosphotransferase
MFYMSDHGESLGESGIYLHGLPYFMAPETQTHVASLFWFGENYDEINIDSVRQKANMNFSHDNLFHSVLGLMEVETSVYNREMDIIYFDQ